MSGFLSGRFSFAPYAPGEQPKDKSYIKLNTNESPYFPSKYCFEVADKKSVENLRLYCDPQCSALREKIARYLSVEAENVLVTNGSDEALAFCFAAFCERGAAFPDITYGFYKVFAGLFGVGWEEIPLRKDFTVDTTPYTESEKTTFLANPNAQTGIYLSVSEIEKILKSNPERVVVIDEAYIDFGGKSCVPLIRKYKNLIVVQTFSKSRSLAGARVGFAVADKELIKDLDAVKYSFNPYNVNSLSAALAAAAIEDDKYFKECTKKIICSREKLVDGLKNIGFKVLPSSANFVLAKCGVAGGELYKKLKDRGVLVRHFDDERIKDYIRITVGSDGECKILLNTLKEIVNEIRPS